MLREQLIPVSLEQQLTIPYRLNPTGLRAFMLSKAGADFDDEDVALARRILPLLTLPTRQASVLEQRGRVLTP